MSTNHSNFLVILSIFTPCPSLPPAATEDRKQFQFLHHYTIIFGIQFIRRQFELFKRDSYRRDIFPLPARDAREISAECDAEEHNNLTMFNSHVSSLRIQLPLIAL